MAKYFWVDFWCMNKIDTHFYVEVWDVEVGKVLKNVKRAEPDVHVSRYNRARCAQ